MTIEHIVQLSKERNIRWMKGVEWRPSQWTNQMAGECGECCNAAKKLDRIIDNIPNANHASGRTLEDGQAAKHAIAHEAADVILSAICVLNAIGADAVDFLVEAFDAKSEEHGFPERLNPFR